ncbi:MAG TPA: AsmA-like C-terminal region-containing protein, partial [Anaeromyxobacter sp.]
ARAVLSGGTLTLEDLDAQVFGGRVSGSGTRVSLAEREPTWRLAARLSSLDLGQALGAFAGRSPLAGKLDGTLDLAGAGADWEAVRRAVTGLAALAVKDGALTTTDLGDEVLGALSKGLAASGRGALAKKLSGAAGGKTSLRDLAGKFQVKDGFLAAQAPLAFRSDVGDVKVGGRIGLDGRLDLTGGVAVPKARLSEVVSGLPLPDALDVPLGLGGTLGAPRVEVRAEDAIRGLVSGQARQARKAVRGEAERAGRRAVEGLFDKLGGKKK